MIHTVDTANKSNQRESYLPGVQVTFLPCGASFPLNRSIILEEKEEKRIIKPLCNHCVTSTRARSIINQTHAIFQLPPSERSAGSPQLRNVCSFILHHICNLVRQKMHV